VHHDDDNGTADRADADFAYFFDMPMVEAGERNAREDFPRLFETDSVLFEARFILGRIPLERH
jgi:hypothetical protein